MREPQWYSRMERDSIGEIPRRLHGAAMHVSGCEGGGVFPHNAGINNAR